MGSVLHLFYIHSRVYTFSFVQKMFHNYTCTAVRWLTEFHIVFMEFDDSLVTCTDNNPNMPQYKLEIDAA